MKLYKVTVATSYDIEAEDENDALDIAEANLANDLRGVTAFGDVFGFNAEEVEA